MITLVFGNLRDLKESRDVVRVVLKVVNQALWVHRLNTELKLSLYVLIARVVNDSVQGDA
jgi:hypothetical protein